MKPYKLRSPTAIAQLRAACHDAYGDQERKTCDPDVKRAVSEAVWRVYEIMVNGPQPPSKVSFLDVVKVDSQIRGKS